MSELYSVVNQAVTTIRNCEDEPITVPGSIQPHGCVLLIDPATQLIRLCSQNTESWLGLAPQQLLGRKYTDTLPQELIRTVEETTDRDDFTPRQIRIGDQPRQCFCRQSGNLLLVELIASEEAGDSLFDLFRHTKGLTALARGENSLEKVCDYVARQIRAIIGFHRVMIYRFDEQNNGVVFAESMGSGIDSYLHLHYPSTDIPAQARQLYMTNLIRLIPDVQYQPVPLVTLNPEWARPEMADLSKSNLRSVSPIHIQYLKNMGVAATFTISLVKDDRLWGLVACHHYEAKNIHFAQQLEAYFLTQILTSQIDVQETAQRLRTSVTLGAQLKTVMEHLEGESNFIELHFERLPQVLGIVQATGCAIIYKDKVFKQGKTPPDEEIARLHQWLLAQQKGIFKTHRLGDWYSLSQEADKASGLLYFPLFPAGQPAVLWFRHSAEKEILWAGNPHLKNEHPLSPRSSFAAWKEIKRGESLPWGQPEVEMGLQFVYQLQKHLAFLNQREEELKFRRLSEQLLKANKELENINWISTHDLKEPLRKIQVFASMIKSPDTTENGELIGKSISRIQAAAKKMQHFIDDLLLYSKMSSVQQAYEPVDLNEIVSSILKDLDEEREQGLFQLRTEKLPALMASRFQMEQLFVNLIGNAIKFRQDGRLQQISIAARREAGWYVIEISDNGVGFSPSMSKEIFEVFRRAHDTAKFSGTGVGLSICRKIMENHGGKIAASGEIGKGARFSLYFPETSGIVPDSVQPAASH